METDCKHTREHDNIYAITESMFINGTSLKGNVCPVANCGTDLYTHTHRRENIMKTISKTNIPQMFSLINKS